MASLLVLSTSALCVKLGMNEGMQKVDQTKFSFNAESDAAYETENLLMMSALYVKQEILWLINVTKELPLVGENKNSAARRRQVPSRPQWRDLGENEISPLGRWHAELQYKDF